MAPHAVRCQWRCAQRSAGRRTAVTVNGRPRDHDQPAGRGQSAPGREGIWDAGSQQERCCRPRPIISSSSHHKLAQQYLFADITPLSQHIAVISPLSHYFHHNDLASIQYLTIIISPVPHRGLAVISTLSRNHLTVISLQYRRYLTMSSPSHRYFVVISPVSHHLASISPYLTSISSWPRRYLTITYLANYLIVKP